MGEGDVLVEVLVEAGVDGAKGAEVLPSKVRIKTRRRQPIRITHLQAAANNTKSGAKVHITVYSLQVAPGAKLLHHLLRKRIEKMTGLNKKRVQKKYFTFLRC